MQLKGALLVLASTFLIGSYGVLSRLIGDGFDDFYQAWTRSLIIVLIMLPWLLKKRLIRKIERSDYTWFAVYAGFTSLTQAPIFYAFNNMEIATAYLLFYVGMVLIMFGFGIFFLGEKLNKTKVMAIVLALAGLLVIFQFSITAAVLFAALMAITTGVAAGGEVASSKKLTGNYSSEYVVWLAWIVVAITNAPVSWLLGEAQPLPALNETWFWQAVHVLASMFGFIFIIEGAKYIEAGVASLIGLFEIVVSIVLAYLVFSETVSLLTAFGAMLIISAAALPNISAVRAKLKES